ncbi:MAG: aminoglycoside phosphotransferase family protein [Acidobacteria bacterium]|nr:aminoglycoside phosphotransferase family protein [Acidobacteriota bacterium]
MLPRGPREVRSVESLRELLAPYAPDVSAGATLSARALRGGLTADLTRVSATRPGAAPEQFVIKPVGENELESAAYAALARSGMSDLAPRLLGTTGADGQSFLLLEYVSRWKTWPWRDEPYARMVIEALARLHASRIEWTADSRYDAHLGTSAAYTIDLLRCAAQSFRDPRLSGGVRAVKALAARLPAARAQLLSAPVFLHGDVHPGNVVIRSERGRRRAVLLDWGRARLGSPFEDVASWLQCLRYFEPSAARLHDRLLLHYVRSAGLGDRITAVHRREYWVAAGSNALAGALGVHLSSVLAARTPISRARAMAAAMDWIRIVRRAVAYLDLSGDEPQRPS